MKILVVDDSRAMRMIVTRTLRQAGFGGHDVKEAGNGVEALAAIESELPDLVISDWNMPEMNGIDLLRNIKKGGHRLKCGFVTSESTGEMRETAMSEGALFLITKPFTAETFEKTLGPVLS